VDSRGQRQLVREWVEAQPTCPSRKEAQRHFPNIPLKHIRSVLQSCKDRLTQGGGD